MPQAGLLSNRPKRSVITTITRVQEHGYEIITNRWGDGDVTVTKRMMLHGPFPPPVYHLSMYSEGEDCLPTITSEQWHTHNKYFEQHPWIVKHRVEDPMVLVINRNGWVADKESLRPVLIKALRGWHKKLTQDLTEAEEALTDAIFNKPI